MRDINRIDKICNELKEIWRKNPNLRLGQLLLNVAKDPLLYYLEDEELIGLLKIFYEKT